MTTFHQPPYQADGLYDPSTSTTRVASRWSRASTTRRRTRSSTRRSWRSRTSSTAAPRAPTPRPATARGSSCRCPTRFLRAVGRLRAAAGRALRRRRCASCRPTRRCARRSRQLLELTVARRGPAACSAGATSRSTRSTSARRRGRMPPVIRQLFVGAGRGCATDQDAFERKLYVIRRICELAAGPGLLRRLVLLAHARLQGHADPLPARRLLSRTCATSASRARWRSCTRASRPTRSRAGSSRTRTA